MAIARKRPRRRGGFYVSPEAITDLTMIGAALAVIVLGVLDILKLYEISAFQSHIGLITLFLTSFLVVSVILEKRFLAARRHREVIETIKSVGPGRFDAVAKYSGIRNVYTSRADYAKFRGATELRAYLARARRSIDIVAYWLSHGIELEGVSRALADMIAADKNLSVRIAVVSPTSPSLKGLASYLGMKDSDLIQRITASVNELVATRQALPNDVAERFILKVYDTLPMASVIMLDVSEPDGAIQVDFKLYKTARQHSLGLEIGRSSSELYLRVAEATQRLLDEADDL